MTPIKRVTLLLLVFILTACASPGLGNMPVPVGSLSNPNPVAQLFQGAADATATPTPFQPLPPTAVYIPTITPTPDPAAIEPTPSAPEENENEVIPIGQPTDQVHILLLGSDARPGQRYFRTDTIIFATISPSLGTVNLLSFPRDLWVNIPGWGQDRINTAWVRGGYPKLKATLEQNFGLSPDFYVLVNFSSFKRIIDSLGGLEVNVGARLSDTYRYRPITIKPGRQNMDADMLLWYVRSRKTSNDFARNRRQQEVLVALGEKLLSMDAVRRAPEMYSIYKGSVTTDMTLIDILPLLPVAAQLKDINNYFVGSGKVSPWVTPGGAMVLLPKMDKIKIVVQKTLSGQ
jgi:LCP family protein required for cell wall assembly